MTEFPTVGDTVAARVRHYRQERKLSVRALADRCAELGMPQLTVGSLSNIERGQAPSAKRGRREVTVDELMVLALALEVPPIMLMLPYGEAERVRLTPEREVHPVAALEWVTAAGKAPLRALFGAEPVMDYEDNASYRATTKPIELYNHVASAVTWAQLMRDRFNQRQEAAEAAREQLDWAKQHRDTTRATGLTLHEEIDALRTRGLLEHDIKLTTQYQEAAAAAQLAARRSDSAAEVYRERTAAKDVAYRDYVDAMKQVLDGYQAIEDAGMLLPELPPEIVKDLSGLPVERGHWGRGIAGAYLHQLKQEAKEHRSGEPNAG